MKYCIALVLLCACADSDPSDPSQLVPTTDVGGEPPGRFDAGAADAQVFDFDRGVPSDASLIDVGVVSDVAPPAQDQGVEPDSGPDPDPDSGAPCSLGWPCNPIVIDRFPQSHDGDTRESPNREIDRYVCAPDTDESGAEVYYAIDIPEPGTLTVSVTDGDGVDIDIHLLEGLDGDSCYDRNDTTLRARATPGRTFLVADTWVNRDGIEQPGPYSLMFDFRPQGEAGNCEVTPVDLRMFWRSCDAAIDCYEANGERFLRTPAVGPVVKEAHLVTVDDGFGNGWPNSSREGLDAHYARSQAATGYAMNRREAWAPAGEGGSEYGQGSTGRKVPVLDEAWYVNMYWRDRPDAGTRLLIRNPENGRTVVASGGYETGPGANTAIGGVTEEIHDHLGTTHRDILEIGFLADQDLPLGPIDCAD